MGTQLIAFETGVKARYDQRFGIGFDWSKRRAILPRASSALRIRVDYAASNSGSGTQWVRNTLAGAKALVVSGRGDRIMMPGGQSTVLDGGITRPVFGHCDNMAGASKTFPFMIGTYDTTDPTNEAKDNTLFHTWEAQWTSGVDAWAGADGPGGVCVFYIRNVTTCNFMTFQNQIFHCDQSSGKEKYGIMNLGGNVTQKQGYLFEYCVFDGVGFLSQMNQYTLPITSNANTIFLQDTVIRRCGFVGAVGKNHGSEYLDGNLNMVHEDNVYVSAGLPRWDAPRTVVDQEVAGTYTYVSAAGATSGGTANCTITVGSTTGLAVNMDVVVTAGTGAWNQNGALCGRVMQILSGTQFLVESAPGTLFSGGATVVSGRFIGANDRRHTWYHDAGNWKSIFRRNISIQDGANNKMCGGALLIENHWNISDPIGIITDPNGADGTSSYWPTGSTLVLNASTQIGCDDTNYAQPISAGWSHQLFGLSAGSVINGHISINQNDPAATNRLGVGGDAHGRPYASVLDMRNSIMIGWGAQDQTTATNTTKSFTGNIWDDAAGGSNLNRTTLANAAINGMLAVTFEDSFRTFDPFLLANTTVVGSNTTFANKRATEYNMGVLMAYNMTRHYADELATVFRRPMGR